jgi:SAM-dependent methyltransferase
MGGPLEIDLREIERLYSENLQKYGIDSRSVGWRDAESQRLRFEKLVEVVEDREAPLTVTELGCGYGAMFRYLIDSGFHVSAYAGYDISPAMLEAASSFVKDGRAEFFQAEAINRMADYAFASGIFNVKFDLEENLWQRHVEQTLRNMHDYSRRGFAFNLLTTYVDYREVHLYYGNPSYFFDFCKRNFSKKVILLHDYGLWEWTIGVKK